MDEGWADRLNERKFRLLVPPPTVDTAAPGVPAEPTAEVIALEPVPLSDPDDNGTVVESVAADAVTGEQGRLALGGLAWSDWVPLNVAVQDATTSPGVYAARTEGQLVYHRHGGRTPRPRRSGAPDRLLDLNSTV